MDFGSCGSEVLVGSDLSISYNPPEPGRFRPVRLSQVFYPSKDGTSVPMFLVQARDLKRDGTNPVFLYGYGGFENSIQPYYK